MAKKTIKAKKPMPTCIAVNVDVAQQLREFVADKALNSGKPLRGGMLFEANQAVLNHIKTERDKKVR